MTDSLYNATASPRVALVHDFLVSMRGADRVFLEITEMFPDADIFTPIYDERGTEGRFAHRRIETSFLQRLRPTSRTFRAMLPFYPAAIESFDLSDYDLVVSSSSAWAHAVICDDTPPTSATATTRSGTPGTSATARSTSAADPVSRAVLRALFRRWRVWDWIAAQRVTRYVAISPTTQARIKPTSAATPRCCSRRWHCDRFTPGPPGDDYLLVSELVSHKRIDEAVEAFTRLGLPLAVVGDGPDLRRLRSLPAERPLPRPLSDDARAARCSPSCRALVVTAVEEFGIAAVEAQAAGRPVMAKAGGGATRRSSRARPAPSGPAAPRAWSGRPGVRPGRDRPGGVRPERAPVRLRRVPRELPAYLERRMAQERPPKMDGGLRGRPWLAVATGRHDVPVSWSRWPRRAWCLAAFAVAAAVRGWRWASRRRPGRRGQGGTGAASPSGWTPPRSPAAGLLQRSLAHNADTDPLVRRPRCWRSPAARRRAAAAARRGGA